MEKTTKIALYSLGGLALATGLFFGVRALFKKTKTNELSSSERRELEILRNKDEANLTDEEKNRINDLDPNFTPNEGETTVLGSCSFPLRVGDSCKQVAQIQLAINEKHNPGSLLSTQGSDYNWACLPATPGQHSQLTIDGDLGPSTAKQLGRWYGLCKSSGFLWEVCNCEDMKISEGLFNSIINGVDVSDEALKSAGFSGFSGYSNFNVPGFGEKYDSPLGKFYKSKYAFVDDYPKQSSMTHSYGMGKGFGFSGPDALSFDGQTGTESEVQSVQQFFDDVP
jgi:hypothetical protein